MACLCSLWESKSWVSFLIPIFEVSACVSSSGHEFTLSAILVLFSTLLFFTNYNKNQVLMDNSTPKADKPFPVQKIAMEKEESDENGNGYLIESQESYSESESIDHFSSEEEEGQSSDIEQRLDFSDDSMSDEESLFEIALPSGDFVFNPRKDQNFKNLNYYKFVSADFHHKKQMDLFMDMYEMNEEDNLIEIDIYMGSIKCSSYPV